MRTLHKLSYKSPNLVGKLSRFIAGAGFSYGLSATFIWLFHQRYEFSETLSYGYAQVIVFGANFLMTRNWVFRSKDGNISSQFYKYFLAAVSLRFTDWSIFAVLDFLTKKSVFLSSLWFMPYILAIISMGTVFPLKFIIYDKAVFKDRSCEPQT